MKVFFVILFLLLSINTLAQKAPADTIDKKEATAVAELGAATSQGLKGARSSYGYSAAVEITPIEDWLELELGVTPTFASHLKATEIDFLVKKPWTLSTKLEFMFGLGVSWDHTTENAITSNTANGEVALDFMYWPFAKHQFGFYLEPAYERGFNDEHEQSIGISGGLLIAIP